MATTWKEFAREASCCRDYTDLGKMLVKLQNVNLSTLFLRYIMEPPFNFLVASFISVLFFLRCSISWSLTVL